jgi:hypothetical protein
MGPVPVERLPPCMAVASVRGPEPSHGANIFGTSPTLPFWWWSSTLWRCGTVADGPPCVASPDRASVKVFSEPRRVSIVGGVLLALTLSSCGPGGPGIDTVRASDQFYEPSCTSVPNSMLETGTSFAFDSGEPGSLIRGFDASEVVALQRTKSGCPPPKPDSGWYVAYSTDLTRGRRVNWKRSSNLLIGSQTAMDGTHAG